MHPDRHTILNDAPPNAGGDYVLYWMQQSQRAVHNPALEAAVRWANEAGVPPLVVFGVMDDYPEANLRHYTFMLEGLQDAQQTLADRGIRMEVVHGHPAEAALHYAHRAVRCVCDRGYLRHQRAWRERVRTEAPCQVDRIEGDVTVPVERVTDKAEYAARTIRPKIHEHLERFLQPLDAEPVEHPSVGPEAVDLEVDAGLDLSDVQAVTDRLDLDDSVPPVTNLFRGGHTEAQRVLDDFLATKLDGYDGNRNQIQSHAVSHMSKYLHFGQISPVDLALQIQATNAPEEDVESYIEELVVRRELAINHVYFRRDTYDAYECIPDWAKETLDVHADDEREYVYSLEELEQSRTHDPYWNAAMKEMRETGYMHNYMRMYWGKKILEWSPGPREAFERTLYLNNKHFIDGRDPNSFAGVLWIFGLHDRGWKEREVYGKVRYMSRGGLERKADPDAYVRKVARLAQKAKNGAAGNGK